MYRISQLAELVGLSRTTLLYYEKIGLIKGQRLKNGYRSYSETDLQRLRLMQRLQAGGLTLKECQACLNAKVEREVLVERLRQLDHEIEQKQQSRQLLAALLGETPLTEWHESLDEVAPDAHLNWLMTQGFSEKEALHLRWLSKDMNTHETYMADFFRVFEALEFWGPGSEQDTLKALSLLPFQANEILEIGCGQGIATRTLAKHAHVTAVDNDEPSLQRLRGKAQALGLSDKITTVCASMTELPFAEGTSKLIWAEGSAYIMGVESALQTWRPLLAQDGILVLSDMVWSTQTPSEDAVTYWQKEYPDIGSVEKRIAQAKAAGYRLLETFPISQQAWDNYYHPLEQRVQSLKAEMLASQVLKDIQQEIDMVKRRGNEVAYQMYILQKD
ncbi:methyltransferase [Photobacterium jeanii]|uniref:Methyltransferase n=1 Tax=Photobacterium jeanii TaxID=858640 RepID=A0A178K1W4_9GAMM|nr:MerR family transcriptional regulator [Photobacterium jeanii]OAN11097.1 methyltransferase [Photobacterium jeanii]PST90611.1 methyltransferase domain-containing protein [Photobacterium jeanii]